MKQEWNNYLQEIQLPERLINNVENKIAEVEYIFGVRIDNIFVSNRRTEQGVEFLSLWLFTEDKAFECKQFISLDDYDVVFIQHNVFYINTKKTNYPQLGSPTNDSSLVCNCYLGNTNISCSFNAVGINCKYLMNIIKSRYIANLRNSIVANDATRRN